MAFLKTEGIKPVSSDDLKYSNLMPKNSKSMKVNLNQSNKSSSQLMRRRLEQKAKSQNKV
jgi:hypothetical protein